MSDDEDTSAGDVNEDEDPRIKGFLQMTDLKNRPLGGSQIWLKEMTEEMDGDELVDFFLRHERSGSRPRCSPGLFVRPSFDDHSAICSKDNGVKLKPPVPTK